MNDARPWHLELLQPRHAAAILHFERENRAYFARSVPDRGDAYFANFDARHAALLADEACRFHVLVDGEGSVLGRFNLVDLAEGSAELGFRVAERVTGRGVAKTGVLQVCELARAKYGLDRLVATASAANAGSLGVLRSTGFVETGRSDQSEIHHVRHLTPRRLAPAESRR